jgi:dTMP kinase
VGRGVFDYWESGMDFQEETDVYHSFVRYQTRLLATFDQLAGDYGFIRVDGNRGIAEVYRDIKTQVGSIVAGMREGRRT